MAPSLFRILLVIVALYALWCGQRDERLISIIFVVGVIASELVLPPAAQRFSGVETNLLAVDVAVFVGFAWVALRSERFWPLWISGLQLTAIFGHLLKSIDIHLFARAYAAALVFWAYPMLIILAIGTWRRQNRIRRELAASV